MPDVDTAVPGQQRVRIQWGRAVLAGLVATIVMTVVMVLLRMNMIKMLGGMIAGPKASATTLYAAGGAIHLMIGVVYGLIYAALFGWLVEWNRFLKGAIYGLSIAAIAFAAMPVMSAMMGGGGASGGAKNPCHVAAKNPCNPCAGGATASAKNPCHPQPAANPCGPKNPCQGSAGNPCNPCGGAGGSWSGVLSVLNHLVYALTLAFVYGKVR